jgi:hypothetical protein
MLKGLRPNELSDVVCRLSEEQPTPLYLTARPHHKRLTGGHSD